ncbi:Penicillinase repressor [bioreactor metagenome]|uniref:Penicillinase repressor n=1 Tax=bioreactor metagenome TaxID=1076179 RepID=A0A645EWT5_9ZZZZ
MKKNISLSDGEWKLMNCLWQKSPRTITQLVAALKEETAWSKHTVISMLSRLEAKGAVTYIEGERAKNYSPALPKEEFAAAETEDFLSRVYGGRLGLMINAMADHKALSKEEIGELYEILKRAEEETGK